MEEEIGLDARAASTGTALAFGMCGARLADTAPAGLVRFARVFFAQVVAVIL